MGAQPQLLLPLPVQHTGAAPAVHANVHLWVPDLDGGGGVKQGERGAVQQLPHAHAGAHAPQEGLGVQPLGLAWSGRHGAHSCGGWAAAGGGRVAAAALGGCRRSRLVACCSDACQLSAVGLPGGLGSQGSQRERSPFAGGAAGSGRCFAVCEIKLRLRGGAGAGVQAARPPMRKPAGQQAAAMEAIAIPPLPTHPQQLEAASQQRRQVRLATSPARPAAASPSPADPRPQPGTADLLAGTTGAACAATPPAAAHPPPPPRPPPPAAMAALTAKLVGGGFERPDADKQLPLDVNYAKLPEWLVRRCAAGAQQLTAHAAACSSVSSGQHPQTCLCCARLQVDRKQVPADWSRKLQAIQAKAAEVGRRRACLFPAAAVCLPLQMLRCLYWRACHAVRGTCGAAASMRHLEAPPQCATSAHRFPPRRSSRVTAPQAVSELPPGFLGQFEGGEEGLDYFLAQQVGVQAWQPHLLPLLCGRCPCRHGSNPALLAGAPVAQPRRGGRGREGAVW